MGKVSDHFLFFLILFCWVNFSSWGKPLNCKKIGSTGKRFECSANNKKLPITMDKLQRTFPVSGTEAYQVKELSLKGSEVKLSPGFFKKFKNVVTLVLSNTGQTEISSEHFKGLENIRHLDLSNNFLTTLPSDFLKALKGDRIGAKITLSLAGNKWNCSCASGLRRALDNMAGIALKGDTFCSSPDFMRKKQIYAFTCDRDECMEENDCDDEAVCINTLDGYNCKCVTDGFRGTGKECTDINECESGDHFCAKEGGKCINEQGKYRCECMKGYKGNGKNCEDVDECETQDCGMEGECTNTIGSFRCDCDAGFEKNDEHVCVDIDECGIKNHTCDAIEHSYCFNLRKLLPKDPGYECMCESGYRKVGEICVRRGSTLELLKYVGVIVGGFIVGLILIIVGSVWLRKRLQRQLEAQQLLEDTVLMAPVVAIPPPVDFASLDMPQVGLPEQEKTQEWEDDDDD
ncbi:pro-epidermal growth factor-like [Montipora foliosa]|uniref:pro-epidermal growth factor-like n=1 Tax=Montipora foliosa TaxID=591990 RepID=UPI0035F1D543